MFTILFSRQRAVFTAALVAAVLAALAATPSPGQDHAQEKHNLYVGTYGVGKYKTPGIDLSWPDQDAATTDALYAQQEGGLWAKVQHTLLVNKQATAAAIRGDMELKERLAQRGDTVYLNFFMHGVDPQQTPTHETWLCPYDCDESDFSTFIPAGYVKAWAQRMSDKGVHVLIVGGCCFAGGLQMEAENVIILMASQANEVSYEEPAILLHGHFFFNIAIFEALNGAADANHDGVITVGELLDYLDKRMVELMKRLEANGQKPQHWCCNEFARKAKDQPLVILKVTTPFQSPFDPIHPRR